MFPHTITIFNVVNDEYNKQVVNNVFYHVEKIIAKEDSGEKYNYAHNVIFSAEAIKKYLSKYEYKLLENKDNYFTLKENDIIVLGKYDKDISGLSDIQKSDVDYFLIKTISENKYGSEELQNIEVTD